MWSRLFQPSNVVAITALVISMLVMTTEAGRFNRQPLANSQYGRRVSESIPEKWSKLKNSYFSGRGMAGKRSFYPSELLGTLPEDTYY